MSFFSIFDTEVTKVEDEIKKESKPIIEAPKGKVSHHLKTYKSNWTDLKNWCFLVQCVC